MKREEVGIAVARTKKWITRVCEWGRAAAAIGDQKTVG
jgi:hypothetical protein